MPCCRALQADLPLAGMQRELSGQPPIYLRVWHSQVGHGQPVVRPQVSESLDWQGQLAVIIGKPGRDIPAEQAYAHVAGYAVHNDVSVREWQCHAMQIASGKNWPASSWCRRSPTSRFCCSPRPKPHCARWLTLPFAHKCS